MAQEQRTTKRDMKDIVQALMDCGDELHNTAASLSTAATEEYLVEELAEMVGIRVKLAYNIRKLQKLTGQDDPAEKDQAF